MNQSLINALILAVETDREFDAVFDLRAKVLQKELHLPEEADLDGFDHIAHHFLAVVDGKPVGTARWRVTLGRKIKLERFSVLAEFRAQGIGHQLLTTILKQVTGLGMEVFLEAHDNVVPFYERHGFTKDGTPYPVSDILHQRMVYPQG